MSIQTVPHKRLVALMRTGGALLGACALTLWTGPAASAFPSGSGYRAQRLCATPRPGSAACLGMRLVPASLTNAVLKADAVRQSEEVATGVTPSVTYRTPFAGYMTPLRLHAAYALLTEASSSTLQTIALVDAYNDPSAEADLAVYDQQFGLPACTTANGCFRKVNQEGHASPLPVTSGGWATEISLDVQMAHAVCPGCRVLLVEANSESFVNLGVAVDSAVTAGATEVSNSYGGQEGSSYASYSAPYNHAGVVITASSGDCGYFNQACGGSAANFPADSPDVVAVGGTALSLSGEHWSSTVWNDGGGGCSVAFTAPLWQSEVANFSATKCATARSVADVAAVADPYTGVDVYDSTPAGNGDPTGWGVWGGTSASSPIVAAEFALAGGSHGVAYPAATLYSNIANAGELYDVVSGSNGSCGGATSCEAAVGYDGPTGVGSPTGLAAFAPAGSPVSSGAPAISGLAEQGQTLTAAPGAWSNSPTSTTVRWESCNASGSSCTTITGATGRTLVLAGANVGSTIRVQESAENASGAGSPAASTPTAAVVSNAPAITSFTPTSGITGSSITITGTAFNGVTQVHFGPLVASFTAVSATQVTATVPNGALAETISLTTPVKTATSRSLFTPTLSVTTLSPKSGGPGTTITITGVGFNSHSSVSIGGVAATGVSYISSRQLKATVPSKASTGPITVTNTTAPLGSVRSVGTFTFT
jgi:subtilase family serine protease